MEFFALGFVAGLVTITLTVGGTLGILDAREKDEEFVKKLVKERGWDVALFDLEFAFSNKYVRIWKRLRKEYLKERFKDGSYKN